MPKFLWLFFLLITAASSAHSQVFGSLANFDVVNDTGKTAHGFEIEIHDIHANQISSIFGAANRWPNMERYGAPSVTEFTDATGFGVKITYKANYSGAWSVGTPSGTLPVNPADSCWPLGAKAYGPLYPCDHFGVSTTVSTPNVKYSWLVEDVANPTVLTPVLATVPNPVWTVTPVPPIANVPQPPQVHVAIAAPAPQFYEFGEPRWVKVTASGTLQDVAVEDLVAENAVIQKAKTQTQIEWQLIQVDAGNPGSGQIDLTGVALDPGAMGVVYRFEFYKYTGARDPETNEAKPLTSDTPVQPDPVDLGQFIVAQNAGINFDGNIPAAPPLPIAPTINASIAGAVVGSPYSQVIDATPGSPNDVLAITVTGLPAGLLFNPVTNTIEGTPSVVGTFPLVIDVQDVTNNTTASASTQIDVADAPIVFSLVFPQGSVNTPYTKTLLVTGGYGAMTYSAFGDLPAGLTLTGDTISGTPTTVGDTMVTLQATDSLGFSQVASATLSIINGPVACSGTNKIITNVTKYWFDIAGGIPNGGQSVKYALPANTIFVPPLLAANGIKSGMVVTYAGTTDAGGFFCLANTMTFSAGLSLAPVTLPNTQVGSVFTNTPITPVGGIPPYTVSVSGLPAGLTFDGINIAGTPALGTDGINTISVSVTDSIGKTVNTTLSLTITAAPVIVPAANLPAATIGVSYTGSVSATGGVGAIKLAVTGLPKGLKYAAGSVTGIPTTAGISTVSVTATDSIGQTVTTTATVVVSPSVVTPITLGAVSTPKGTVGIAYKGTVKAIGGVGKLTWKGAGLPAGTSLSATGVISGIPTMAGAYNPVLTVTDTIGQTATVNATIAIVDAPVISCTISVGGTAGLNSKGTITAISTNIVTNTNVITFKTIAGTTVKVSVPACATIQWNAGANAFALGQVFEWNGYKTAATGNVAQNVVIN